MQCENKTECPRCLLHCATHHHFSLHSTLYQINTNPFKAVFAYLTKDLPLLWPRLRWFMECFWIEFIPSTLYVDKCWPIETEFFYTIVQPGDWLVILCVEAISSHTIRPSPPSPFHAKELSTFPNERRRGRKREGVWSWWRYREVWSRTWSRTWSSMYAGRNYRGRVFGINAIVPTARLPRI